MINSIESIFKNDNGRIYITAVVEGAVQVYAQTLYDPAEYGSALCESSFELEENESLPDNENELIEFVEGLDLEWKVVDNSDYYLD